LILHVAQTFAGTGINTAWVTSNLSPYTTRATGTAFMISTGALGESPSPF
jgi:hypothetical protein